MGFFNPSKSLDNTKILLTKWSWRWLLMTLTLTYLSFRRLQRSNVSPKKKREKKTTVAKAIFQILKYLLLISVKKKLGLQRKIFLSQYVTSITSRHFLHSRGKPWDSNKAFLHFFFLSNRKKTREFDVVNLKLRNTVPNFLRSI